jgi:hypothetical protein
MNQTLFLERMQVEQREIKPPNWRVFGIVGRLGMSGTALLVGGVWYINENQELTAKVLLANTRRGRGKDAHPVAYSNLPASFTYESSCSHFTATVPIDTGWADLRPAHPLLLNLTYNGPDGKFRLPLSSSPATAEDLLASLAAGTSVLLDTGEEKLSLGGLYATEMSQPVLTR